MSLPIASALIVLASSELSTQLLDDARVRVELVFDDQSPMGHAKAQIALMRAADKHCKGKGRAVSEGTLTVNRAEPLRKGKDALEISEIYRCVPKG